MARLIDADRLLRDTYFQEDRYPCSHLIRMAVGEQRTIDAVPVVRCKDCKFYDEQDELADIAGWTDGEPYCFCEEMMEYVPRKGFCHKGERKDNE